MTLKSDANFKGKMNCGFKYEWRIWWIFTQRLKAWIFLFDKLFLSKIHKVSATIIQRSYLSWHWTVMQNLNKPDLLVSKIAWGIGWTFIRAPKSLKNCTLIGSFYAKRIMFQLGHFIRITGLAVSKMPHVRQSHAIKHVLYYGVR